MLFVTAKKSSGASCVQVGFSTAGASGAAGHCVEVAFSKAAKSNSLETCVEVGFGKAASSLGNGSCVEVSFDKADQSVTSATCVEVSTHPHQEACSCDDITVGGKTIEGAQHGDVLVRDTKDNGTGPIIIFKAEEWARFLTEVDEAGMSWPRGARNGMYLIAKDNVSLYFTNAEWDAFLDGVRNGEFQPAGG